jgi:Family of unknown function (DUF6428)
MKISELKKILQNIQNLSFEQENGARIPDHFHVTELGIISKHFIDCGGTVRTEQVANFQLWHDNNDLNHRLTPEKLLGIITMSEKLLGLQDLPIEVEYQSETIGKYDLNHNGTKFVLVNKQTNCLALDKCGIPDLKTKIQVLEMPPAVACTPGGCC